MPLVNNPQKLNNHSGYSSDMDLSEIMKSEIDLEKYKFIKILGQGNYGVTKLAKHGVTGEQCAIKIIDKSKLSPTSLKEVFGEAEIIKTLDHPNIISLIEIIHTESTLYLVMEYACKGDLFSRLDYGRMEEKEAREKFVQIMSAIRHCHKEKNVIHRDLKPENILFDGHNNIKIADFGLSEKFIPNVKLNTHCGTPEYMAPEVFQGLLFDGPKSDVWSLGVLLYEMLTGNVPFTGSDWPTLCARVLRGKFHLPDYISSDCGNLINKMLALDPDQRANIDVILSDEWINFAVEQKQFRRTSSHEGG